jgi:hypothetical protein
MKPSQLEWPLKAQNPELTNKNADFFKLKESNLKRQRLDASGTFHVTNLSALKSSYEVSLLVVKKMKPTPLPKSSLFLQCKQWCGTCLVSKKLECCSRYS